MVNDIVYYELPDKFKKKINKLIKIYKLRTKFSSKLFDTVIDTNFLLGYDNGNLKCDIRNSENEQILKYDFNKNNNQSKISTFINKSIYSKYNKIYTNDVSSIDYNNHNDTIIMDYDGKILKLINIGVYI